MAVVAPAIPYLMAAVAASSALKQGIDARHAAKTAEAAQDTQNLNIRKAAAQEYNDLSAGERDAVEVSLEESIAAQSEFFKAKSRVNLLSGATGTSGKVVDSMIHDLKTTHGTNLSTITRNREFQLDDIRRSGKAIRHGAQQRQGARYFARPSALGVGLSAVSAGLQGYSAGKGLEEAAPAGGG